MWRVLKSIHSDMKTLRYIFQWIRCRQPDGVLALQRPDCGSFARLQVGTCGHRLLPVQMLHPAPVHVDCGRLHLRNQEPLPPRLHPAGTIERCSYEDVPRQKGLCQTSYSQEDARRKQQHLEGADNIFIFYSLSLNWLVVAGGWGHYKEISFGCRDIKKASFAREYPKQLIYKSCCFAIKLNYKVHLFMGRFYSVQAMVGPLLSTWIRLATVVRLRNRLSPQ